MKTKSRSSPRGERGKWTLLADLAQDLRFGFRTLRKRPLFTFVAVLTLALGIGASGAIFSVVHGVLLRDLPYENPDTLVSIWLAHPAWQGDENLGRLWDRMQYTYRDYLDLRDGATLLEDVAVFAGWGELALTGVGRPEQLSVGLASANLFRLLGVRPVLGRCFLPGEDGDYPGQGARVAVLGHELWQRRFGGDPGILGRTLTLNGNAYEAVGVLPPGFRLESVVLTDVNLGLSDVGLRDLWVPLGQQGIDNFAEGNAFEVLGRLLPGVTPEQGRAEAQGLLPVSRNPAEREVRLAPRKDVVTSGFAAPILIVFAAAGLLLLIACANVATLLIGEAAGRRHEMATRAALGAGRLRVVRQLLTESVLLGLLGSGVGILFAHAGTRSLVALAPPIPRLDEVAVNGWVLLFAVGAGVSTGMLFGLAPLATLWRHSLGEGLAGRGWGATEKGRSLQGAAVSLQVALTVVLLVAGGLLVRSLLNLAAVDPGFDPGNLAVLRLSVPEGRYATQAEATRFFQEVVRDMEAVPGVLSVAGSYGLPFPGGAPMNSVQIEGRGPEGAVAARRRTVLPAYHETLGIPLLDGRSFSEADEAGRPRVMIISESMARRHWPLTSPIGATVRFWGETWTIVGIAGDVRHTTLRTEGEPTFYVPFAQVPRRDLTLVARTAGDPARILPLLREAVWSVDADMPVTDVGTIASLVARSGSEDRYRALLIVIFGSVAALLAAAGIFGVTARGVAQRTREIGIRVALGARASALVGMILRRSLSVGLVGTVAGLLAAAWTSRLLSHFLFGVPARDLLTYGSVALLLMLVCLIASCIPAARAAKVAPTEVLRQE